jgi:surface antigen
LQTQRRAWKCFQQYNVVNFVVSSCVVAALVLHLADAKQNVEVGKTHTQPVVLSQCVPIVPTEITQTKRPSTLSAHTQHTVTVLDAAPAEGKQRIRPSHADPNVVHIGQRCIQGNASQSAQNADIAYKMSIAVDSPVIFAVADGPEALLRQALPAIHFVPQKRAVPLKSLPSAPHGFLSVSGRSMPLTTSMSQGSASSNVFPYGQCTWWANQRYHQLHGRYVPWRINANAFQWVARAIESGWRVSGTPTVGSIIVLQPGVEGAYGLGHVGIVERILQNGKVIASSMNWGNRPNAVTQATYVLRSGVSFISSY